MAEQLRYAVFIEPHPLWEAAHFTGQQLVGRFVCAGDAQAFAHQKRNPGLIIALVVDRRGNKQLYRSESA